MTNEQRAQDSQPEQQQTANANRQQDEHGNAQNTDFDGLKDKKPEELTPEELRLMADTMPGEGPGD